MPKTLILIFHPDFTHSRANRALADAASQLANTEIFDVQSAYPDNRIDVDAEVQRLLGADRIVFQFPIQWYAAPPILQAWQNAVLTRMYYLNYESEGRLLEGKPLQVAVTAGNTPSAYTARGTNLLPLREILTPLRVTAHRCGLLWTEPFIVYEAMKAPDATLRQAGQAYAQWLSHESTQLLQYATI
ncbi:NAD(P)H-dependent oxidoreductase [Phyllobacterium zundukense]|uniref:NAD(P)H dehydrogenase n=1 Tax=Phyllobacterium zundukense TaxID=1867719 RepID=A0A2N9VRW4_9HYPH|nr:NAD(P)H-dependent oxidoreductase [Phyllobacterium zundukense]ATU92656.1 NAD(P)H dehydrogenase [Phyllobacterium zundukense]PIO42232.1 NAD(P)H dehydrogenase [Phyllobacterium zundukense]